MGPPGAGKGTQAVGIAAHYHVPAISSGSLFRENIKMQTDLGQRVESLIARGEFVPDVLTTSMVFRRILMADCADGWLLDGYPRTLNQVVALDLALNESGHAIDAVIALEADPQALVERMVRRAGIEGRADDNEETIRNRIDIYHQETKDLLGVYRERGVLVEVDAIGSVGEVQQRLLDALEARLGR
jgi:adenylate kinase